MAAIQCMADGPVDPLSMLRGDVFVEDFIAALTVTGSPLSSIRDSY